MLKRIIEGIKVCEVEILIDSYNEKREERLNYKQLKDLIAFGFFFGLVITFIGFTESLCYTSWLKRFFYGVFILGLSIIIISLAFPILLKYPYRGFELIIRKISNFVLKLLLAVLYCVMVIPVGLIFRKKKQLYGFYEWDNSFEAVNIQYFSDIHYKPNEKANKSISKYSFLRTLKSIFGTLIQNRFYIVIPLALFIIVLSFVLLFVASGVAPYFIYSLF